MEYKNITIYYGDEENFEKAVIETNLGTLEITDKEKLDKVLEDFAKQKGINLDTLISNEELVKVLVSKSKSEEKETDLESESEFSDEEFDALVFGTGYKKKKEKKEKSEKKEKKGIIKKLVAYGSVLAILVTGTIHLDKHKFDGKIAKFLGIKTSYSDDVNKSTNYDVKTYDSGKKTNSDYDKVMEGVTQRQEQTSQTITQLSNGKTTELTHDQILTALNDNSRIANSSIFEVSQYINGKELTGKAYYNNFENIFTKGSMDYYAVKKFSDLRNQTLRMVYENKNIAGAKSSIRDFYSLYTEFFMNRKSCVVNIDGKDIIITYSELSDMAKATILELGVGMLNMKLDYNYYNNSGDVYTKTEIYAESVSVLEGELVPSLINKGKSK